MLETNLDLILETEKLGEHHAFSIEISFPEAYTTMFQARESPNDFTNVCMSYVFDTLYDRTRGYYDLNYIIRFKGDDWPSQLECQIASAYTSLMPREGHRFKPIPRRQMTHSGGQDSFTYEFGLLVGEALGNSIRHGHKMDPRKTAHIRSFLGQEGLIFSVEDEGEGFDVRTIAHKVNNQKSYQTGQGNGYGTTQFRDGIALFRD